MGTFSSEGSKLGDWDDPTDNNTLFVFMMLVVRIDHRNPHTQTHRLEFALAQTNVVGVNVCHPTHWDVLA